MHFNSELLFKKYSLSYFKDNMRVLEIGPQGIPSAYQQIVNKPTITWHTLDLYDSYPGLTYTSHEEYNYPIDGESYDLIISGQVMEHVKKIWLWLAELKRIVKTNGTIILINPVSWPYHAIPVDCWRIYPEGMKALCDQYQLDIILCTCESIEQTHFQNSKTPTVPGQSYAMQNQKLRVRTIKIWNSILYYVPLIRKLRVPVEVAYDTITIAKKDTKAL